MSVLSRQGVPAQGTSTVSVNRAVPVPLDGVVAGNPRWLTDTLLIFQAFIDGAWGLWTWDLAQPSAPLVHVSPQGQNELFAGAGFWAANLNTGYRDSRGLVRPDWAVMGGNAGNGVDDLMGLVAVCPDRATGHGLSVWDGFALTAIETVQVQPEMCYRGGFLLYRLLSGEFKSWHHDEGHADPPSQVPVLGCWHSGVWRLGYQDGRGLVVFGWDQTEGLCIHDGGSLVNDFAPDIQTLEDGTVKVVSSRTQGQAPGDLQVYIVNTAASTVNGQPREWVNLLAPPQEPIVPLPPLTHPAFVFTGAPTDEYRWTWWNDPNRDDPNVRGMYFEFHESEDGKFEQELDEGLPWCHYHRNPAAIHPDNTEYPRWFENAMQIRCDQERVLFAPVCRAYLTFATQTVDDVIAIFRWVIQDLKGRHPYVGVWLQAYELIPGTAAKVEELMHRAWAVCAEEQITYVSFFGHGDPRQTPRMREIVETAKALHSLAWPLPGTPDPFPPDPPEPPMPIVSEADFKRHQEQTADITITPQTIWPADMSRDDVINACGSWGNRSRANGVNAKHETMLGAYGATRSERGGSSWPTPMIDGSQAKYWDDLVKRAITLDKSEGL